MKPKALVGAALVAVILAAAWVAQLLPGGSAASEYGPVPIDAAAYKLPQDIEARLNDLEFGPPPSEAIAAPGALAIAKSAYDPEKLGAKSVAVYIATITAPGTFRGPSPIRNRAVWIVHLSGMSIPGGSLQLPDQTPPSPHVLTTLFVVIDAVTGDFLYGEWQE